MRLKPFPHQIDLIKGMTDFLLHPQSVPLVVDAAPNSGKTYMSAAAIENYIHIFPKAKVLVLTYAQDILRKQYTNMCIDQKVKFNYVVVKNRADFEKAYNSMESGVIITLPQTIKNYNLPKFDVVIVDEAHQFYFAKMVQDIIKKSQPSHQLLLTGTPYPFVEKNQVTPGAYKFLSLDLLDLIAHGRVAKNLSVEVVQSNENISYKDYNEEGNLREDFKFDKVDIISSLHQTLKYISLKEKTLAACHNIDQASIINAELVRLGVDSVLSTSENDPKSKNIAKFTAESGVKVLCVVYRGILGFDLPEMCNGLDFTASQNPSRIFQLFCRNVRVHPTNLNASKVYIKVVPASLKDWFITVMEGTLRLASKEYSRIFNGKNFMDLPVLDRPSDDRKRNGSNEKTPSNKIKPNYTLFNGMSLLNFFSNISSSNSSTTIGQVRQKLLGIAYLDPEGKQKEIIDWIELHPILENGKIVGYMFPNAVSKDPIEAKLGKWFSNYTAHTHSYDPDFIALIKFRFNWLSLRERKTETKDAIDKFYAKHGYLPPTSSKDPYIRKLAGAYQNYTFERSETYDKDFAEKHLNSITYREFFTTKKNNKIAEECLEWNVQEGQPPVYNTKNPKEKLLARFIVSVRMGKQLYLDENLRQRIKALKNRHQIRNEKRLKSSLQSS